MIQQRGVLRMKFNAARLSLLYQAKTTGIMTVKPGFLLQVLRALA